MKRVTKYILGGTLTAIGSMVLMGNSIWHTYSMYEHNNVDRTFHYFDESVSEHYDRVYEESMQEGRIEFPWKRSIMMGGLSGLLMGIGGSLTASGMHDRNKNQVLNT